MSKEQQRAVQNPDQIVVDPHFSPQFYAELWGVSP
jgi:hypothetical protein